MPPSIERTQLDRGLPANTRSSEKGHGARDKSLHCFLAQMVVGRSVWPLNGIRMGEWAFLNLPKMQKQGVASAVVSFVDSALVLDHCLIGKKLRRVFWRDQNLTQP